MTIQFWKPDEGSASQTHLEEMARMCGRRSAVLAKLKTIAKDFGFSVPEFLVVPVSFAHEINERYKKTTDHGGDPGYLALSDKRVNAYQALIEPHLPEIVSAIKTITSVNPILRGSSSLEGSNSLSFAGVCKTVIPQKDIELEDYLKIGMAKVLAGSFTPYANYYLSHHDIHFTGRDVGLIAMKLVAMPVIHGAAYVYPDELRARYFLNPIVGSPYVGGHEMILRRDGFASAALPDHAESFQEIWRHIANVFWNLHDYFYGEPVPLDMEFLVDQDGGKNIFHIVQMRPISRPHEKNYLQARALLGVPEKARGDIVIPPSHLYHSVGEVEEGLVIDIRNSSRLPYLGDMTEGILHPVFLISHQRGEGTFNFLKALPHYLRNGVALIAHPEHREHDHLQYSVYEDRRLDMVIHCDERMLADIAHGDKIAVTSNGNTASLNIKKKNMTNKFTHRFLDPSEGLPAQENISAVFLVAFKDGNILAAQNERGWDIPGGHLEGSEDCLTALKREVSEEAGAEVSEAMPYAVLTSSTSLKVMVFFASNTINLAEFVPSEDALSRDLLDQEELLRRYYGDKELLRSLIEGARKKLGLQ